jgi:tetratricopeptide (TPR) repeat protein
MTPRPRPNPFPGLRPYEPDEDHLFFGREKETDDLLRRLRSARFLPVIGTSGCGKSSLVRCGLIPALHSGYMVRAGSSWRVAVMRPGENPIGHLAAALDQPSVLGRVDGELASTNRVILDATLRRGSLGLVAAVREAHLPAHDNVLVVVDQFEELFRYRASQITGSRDDAVAFVKLLLEAAGQQRVPIYVVLTMRSDFLGDCMEYPGLPEAINESHYLVPRMTRDELRAVITGPISVADGSITPRLVVRLLNELGDNQDELPLLQHVLMRMWDHSQRHGDHDRPIDVEDYAAVGTLRDALSIHADEAYAEAEAADAAIATERIFKALTDTFSDPRGVRRPTKVAELAAIGQIPEASVLRVVEIFRREGRSFLMPPPAVPLTRDTVVDVSHESLMRGWRRLVEWAQQERASAAIYNRLSREASWCEEGAAGLWGDPELELGLRWRRDNEPTAAWARRYDDAFEAAMRFLDRSERERERQKAERRAMRVRNLQIAWGSAAVLLVAFVLAVWQGLTARREYARAETNLALATTAVDELLISVDRDPASIGADVPQMAELRGELLERAKRFYAEFITQQPNNEEFLREMAAGHYRLGHIYRMLVDPDNSVREYREAIAQFSSLTRSHPENRDYQQGLGNAYNWLGETLRQIPARYSEAQQAYDGALNVQTALVTSSPQNPAYQQEVARTRYNRGILFANGSAPDGAALAAADFREAIRILEDVLRQSNIAQARQDLARVYNNLAALRAEEPGGISDAKRYYAKAIDLHEQLVAAAPGNREYQSELAKFANNYSDVLRELREFDAARQSSTRALALLDDLVRPAPTLGIELADAFSLRGRILQAEASPDAIREYQHSFDLFRDLERGGAARLPDFHVRFGDLLQNLVSLALNQPGRSSIDQLLDEAVRYYIQLGITTAASGPNMANTVLDNLQQAIADLPESRRARWNEAIRSLEQVTVPANGGR